MKIKLYLDFDGVILNTIDLMYDMIKKQNIVVSDDITDFFENLDWQSVIDASEPINDSINNIKKIIDTNLYDVTVLSHVASDYEANVKRLYLSKHLPDVDFISVYRDKDKCDVVNCKNAVLVDDYMGNLKLWYKKGGIPVKFSDNGKKYNFMSISNLYELIVNYDRISEFIINNK